jgi:5-methylcytosine-specific restriction endonuclease McrA
MSKKPSRKTLVRKLDAIVKQIVIDRDVTCVCCGTSQNLTPGHLFSRVAYSTRWDLDNVFAQCINCNFRHESDPYPLMNYAELILGKDGVEALHFKYVHPIKYKDFQLQELLDQLESLVR